MSPSGGSVAVWSLPADLTSTTGHYVHPYQPDALMLYAGRPVIWEADGTCVGSPSPDFSRRVNDPLCDVDGRYVSLWSSDTGLRVRTDGLGAYPAYELPHDRGTIVSNSLTALRRLSSGASVNSIAVSSFAGLGWPLGGAPLDAAVRRLEPAAVLEYRGGGWRRLKDTGPSDLELAEMDSCGLDQNAAVRDLAALTGALMDWPGRPVEVALTGGRDSRVTFLGAVATGGAFTAKTLASPGEVGFPNTADVRVARELARATGRELSVQIPNGDSGIPSLAAIVDWGGGSASLGDVGSLIPVAPRFEINVTGQGGEIARAYYGTAHSRSVAGMTDVLCSHHMSTWPAPLLTAEGTNLVTGAVHSWVTERYEAALPSHFLPDLFYIRERMGGWAAVCHSVYERWADTVFPLWSHRMIRHMLGPTLPERGADVFHSRLTRSLNESAWTLRFAGSEPQWKPVKPTRADQLAARARRLANAGGREARRRVARLTLPQAATSDPLSEAQLMLRRSGLPDSGDEMWHLVSRARAEGLLSRNAALLDPRSRQQLWRLLTLATYFEQP